jgi:hypothetical protein
MGFEEKKPGTEGYDPCAKYDYIYRCLIHNMAYVTDRADLDCTIDETTWGFAGYSGDAGGRLMNKPVSKGKSMKHHYYYCNGQRHLTYSKFLCRWTNNHANGHSQ